MGRLWSTNALPLLQTLDSERRQNDNRMLRNKFVVVFKCPGWPGHYQLSNARPPGQIVKQMPGVCPGGMLAVGIDSHITISKRASIWPSICGWGDWCWLKPFLASLYIIFNMSCLCGFKFRTIPLKFVFAVPTSIGHMLIRRCHGYKNQ